MLTDWAAYAGLFLSAFGSATLLPLQSETVLGSWVNWWLGRYLEHFRGRRWFPVGEVQLLRAQRHYRRYGRWTLLLSWVPVIGDPLTLVAGIMREPCWSFLLIVGLAKTLRYLVLAALVLGWAG